MPAPYTKSFSFDAISGEENYIELGFPHRGHIKGFVLTQVGGAAAGFNADLFNSSKPRDDAGSESSAEGEGIFAASNYRIIPPELLVASGDTISLHPTDSGYAYRNVDGSYSVPVRKLYLRVHPSGSGTKSFELTLTTIPVM